MKVDFMQMEFLHPKLRKLLKWLETMMGFEFTGTSIHRMNDPGVHGQLPVRGWDLRIRNEKIGRAIAAYINEHWVYDPARPNKKCAVCHGKDANFHIHIQVHKHTYRK